MQVVYFIGIDVAKHTFDYTVLNQTEILVHDKVEYTAKKVREWIKSLKKRYKAGGQNTIFCLEYTGVYAELLVNLLQKSKAKVWVESALQIKSSLGLQRGKNDKVDSLRIAKYAYLHRSQFKQWVSPTQSLEQLRHLSNTRRTLQLDITQLKFQITEHIASQKNILRKVIASVCKPVIKELQMAFKTTEKLIKTTIKADKELFHLYKILTSVVGVGSNVALALLIYTNAFKKFSNAKKFACYSGIAPFEHSSGTSTRHKARVSGIANKKMKATLHIAALAAIRAKGELREYYVRKVAEGRPKLSVINAVRNKIVARVFSCIDNDKRYQKDFSVYQQMRAIATKPNNN